MEHIWIVLQGKTAFLKPTSKTAFLKATSKTAHFRAAKKLAKIIPNNIQQQQQRNIPTASPKSR